MRDWIVNKINVFADFALSRRARLSFATFRVQGQFLSPGKLSCDKTVTFSRPFLFARFDLALCMPQSF